MILNLDANFNPFQKEQEIQFEKFIFSGGEPHIKINPNFDIRETVSISHRLNSFEDLGLLCLAVDALRGMGVRTIRAFIPYFPAARQDRVMVKGEPLSVKVYAEIINALQFETVFVFDPHSEVTPALVNRCIVIPNHSFIKDIISKANGKIVLISPDGGALKKIYKVSEALGGVEVIECSKSRDVKTGKLTGFKVYADDLQGRNCLIVDDICDGGATFIGLADELKKKNAGNLFLAVSHGIFSKGFEELKQKFAKMFTTNSVKDFVVEGVEQIKIVCH